MGRLVIAHHKSYHPYKRDNIERVRRDEEEAQLKEAKEEGRMMLADSEARMDRLREKAGAKHKSRDDDMAILAKGLTAPSTSSLTPNSANKHINFFEDLEGQNAVIAASTKSFREKGKGKSKEVMEDEKGVRLGPSSADLNPWYSTRHRNGEDGPEDSNEDQDDKRRRDALRKSVHDPLTSITRQLHGPTAPAQPYSSSPSISFRRPTSSASEERATRETSERERARALIARKKREAAGSVTPSTVVGDDEYGDMFNKKAVREAHAHRDKQRWKTRRWDDQ